MFINPTETLKQLNLKKDITAVDIGCGSGGWTLPLARILEKGGVMAVDILEEPLSALQGKARSLGLDNIKTIISDIEDGVPQIQSESCDFALITNVLFQVESREVVFQEISRILKTSGQLLAIDWLPEARIGPKQGKISVAEVKTTASKFGLRFERELPSELYHYALLFVKE